MKVLKILAIVLGAIALLTGVGMFLGSTAVGKGNEALNAQMVQQGFLGPVDGVVKSVDQSVYTVDFTDQQGTPRTGKGASAGSSDPEVGDSVQLFYFRDSPDTIVIADLDLGSVGNILRTGGLITGGAGLALLIAGTLGLLLGRKPPAVPPYPAQPYPQQYPPQQYPPGVPPQYPPQPYPPQQYPPQPYPPQQYPPAPPQQ